MTTSSLTIRLDSNLKEEAARIVEHYGLDISTATRAFYTQIVNTGSIPLSFNYDQPNDESLIAIAETEEMIKTGSGKSYTSGKALIEAALA
jgi:DNA-damage-inducible protein J